MNNKSPSPTLPYRKGENFYLSPFGRVGEGHYAIIDLGTNTFNLLIAKVPLYFGEGLEVRPFKKIFKTKIAVKLGEDGFTKRIISPVPFQRGIDALKEHKQTIQKYKADKIFAFATSAIRGAENGKKFISEAKKQTGIEIRIISGDEEAELIFYGVRQAVNLGKEKSLIMDIGGGSTEFIIADSEKIYWKKSFLLGVSRLLEKFKPSDPVKKSEIKEIENYFDNELQLLFFTIKNQKSKIENLIGSSGSFTSYADMIEFYSPEILRGKTCYHFKLKDLFSLYDKIVKSTLNERLQMKGLVPFRADNIVLASILTQYVIKKLKIKNVILSKYALKEGVLWAVLRRKI